MVVCFVIPSNWFRSARSAVKAVLSANLEAVPDWIPDKVVKRADEACLSFICVWILLVTPST